MEKRQIDEVIIFKFYGTKHVSAIRMVMYSVSAFPLREECFPYLGVYSQIWNNRDMGRDLHSPYFLLIDAVWYDIEKRLMS